MEPLTPTATRFLAAFCGVAFSLPCIFFGWYSARLLYLNLTMPADEIASHRTGGMLIGALAFPILSIICALATYFFMRTALKGWLRK